MTVREDTARLVGSDDHLTVADLLAEPRLGLILVTGTAGLDRRVRWAHSTELLHPEKYLRGGELVLTLGASLRSAGDHRTFVRAVASGGASAIGYGTGDVTPDVPEPLRLACDQESMPLFAVPNSVPFMTITEWLAEERTRASATRQGRAEFGRILDLVRNRLASPDAVAARLAEAGLSGDVLQVRAWHEADGVPSDETALVGTTDGLVLTLSAADAEEPLPHPDVCGIGYASALGQLPDALTESIACLDLSDRYRVPVEPDRLATFTVLLSRLTDDQLTPFAVHLAEPLVRRDERHGSALLPTLRAYLRHDGSPRPAADELFLHVNTLRNRLARITELTGQDPTTFAGRATLAVAVTAHDRRTGPFAAPRTPRPG